MKSIFGMILSVLTLVMLFSACESGESIRMQDQKIDKLIEENKKLRSDIEQQRKTEEERRKAEEDRKKQQCITERKPVCEFLYEIYRQCYAKGIQSKGDLFECVRVGAEVWENAAKKFPAEVAEGLGKVCAMACKESSEGKGLPSYSEFINNEWKWCSCKE